MQKAVRAVGMAQDRYGAAQLAGLDRAGEAEQAVLADEAAARPQAVANEVDATAHWGDGVFRLFVKACGNIVVMLPC